MIVHFFCVIKLFQLIEKENVKAVVSMNEDYELQLFSNNAEVRKELSNFRDKKQSSRKPSARIKKTINTVCFLANKLLS